jgi:subtilase family serine protease
MFWFRSCSVLVCSLLASAMSATAVAQHTPKVSLVRSEINDNKTVTFNGNVRPEATAENDRGAVDDSMPLASMELILARSPESQAAFEQYLQDLQNPASPNFHKWLTAAQVGDKFGPSDEDVARLTNWMTSKGFTVSGVTSDGMLMVFSGTAGDVRKAFHSSIHNLSVKGAAHIANMTNPQIPEALAPVVAGILPVNDFKPHTMSVKRAATAVKPNVAAAGGFNLIGAADLAQIYNFNPLYKAGIAGQGQTIVLVQDSDLFTVNDFILFRKNMGLSRLYPTGNNLSVVHPTGAVACTDPGINGADGEAAIDVEWSSAAAPAAQIVLANCADSRASGAANFGGFIAMENMLNAPNPPMIYSISFGESENEVGATGNLFINNLYALGAAEGASIFVSSGDEGAASSDADQANATHGIAVSGFTSTPNNVSVGGTDYGDTFLGETSVYWNPTDGANFLTAKSYVPEIPWNDSCASQLIYLTVGFPSAVGTNGFCNSATASADGFITTASGSGGPSNCATGTATTRGVTSGTCAGYPKPSWQSVLGNPADGVRDIPDVSLFAANGVWGHYYVVCYSDTDVARTEGDAGPCTTDPSQWAGFGGTSVSTPIWAGIQALVNQKTGTTQGNPNPVLYGIADTEYGSSGNAGCNSTLGNGTSSSCIFYDVTLGDMDVNCTSLTSRGTVVGTFNCFNSGGTEGVLSVSDSVLEPAYTSSVGWDFATGIGTTNAFNLVMSPAWPKSGPPSQ